MLANDWEVQKSWKFKKRSHINILELRAVERLVEDRAKSGPIRFLNLVDSNVTRCALGKGRSASKAISGVLRRISAVLVAYGLYIVNPFRPTRLNCADDPTRLRPQRPSVPGIGWRELPSSDLWKIAGIRPTRRWASNWIRLVLALIGPVVATFADRSSYRLPPPQRGLDFEEGGRCPPCPAFVFATMDFDSSLGFPGEGPIWALHLLSAPGFPPFGFPAWIWPILGLSVVAISLLTLSSLLPSWALLAFVLSRCLSCCPRVLAFWVLLAGRASGVEAMVPGTAAEMARAAERLAGEPLQESRPTLASTGRLRERYWAQFEGWLRVEGIDFESMLLHHVEFVDEINSVLASYGCALFHAGKSYNQFAETINTLTTKKPALRRLMQGAWDVAFSWLHTEPGSHHVAMPWQVLLGMITVSLTWGWTLFAGSLALCWGALLRPGELFAARRADLLLPRDVDSTVAFGLLSIQQPKTRRTGAKHQAAKLDVPDLLAVVDFCFGNLQASAPLWPWSGQTFRTRFRDVISALRLPVQKLGDMKALDPGSLRSGGATWHLQTTEDGEYTRRKGRWISAKIMEIYIQESASLLYLKRIPISSRDFVLCMAHLFPPVFAKVQLYLRLGIAPTAWYVLLQKEVLGCTG